MRANASGSARMTDANMQAIVARMVIWTPSAKSGQFDHTALQSHS